MTKHASPVSMTGDVSPIAIDSSAAGVPGVGEAETGVSSDSEMVPSLFGLAIS